MQPQTIDPVELHAKVCQGHGVDLVDVRTVEEFMEARARGARSLPLHGLTPEALHRSRPAGVDGPVYLICRSGGRSHRACEMLAQAGYMDVVNVLGGTLAWQAAGLPMESSHLVERLGATTQIGTRKGVRSS